MKHRAAMASQVLWFLFIAPSLAFFNLLPLLMPVVAATDSVMPQPPAPPSGCSSKCGDVNIPYPFAIDNGDHNCSWLGAFNLACDTSISPPQIKAGNVKVANISLEAGEMVVFGSYSQVCYLSPNTTDSGGAASTSAVNNTVSRGGVSSDGDNKPPIPPSTAATNTFSTTDSPFLISAVRNEFTAIGCNTVALLKGRDDWSYNTGCITYCVSLDEAARDGENCTGLGCCQTSISEKLNMIQVNWSNDRIAGHNPAWSYSPCSYAFVAEKGWYSFKRDHLIPNGSNSFPNRFGKGLDTSIRLVLDWAIRDNGSCQLPAKEGRTPSDMTAPACVSLHSYCVNARQGPGYLCNCSDGYTGNPYIKDGCKNINECALRKVDPAKYEKLYPCSSASTCHDREGDYVCKCKFWYRGNGKSDKGCQLIIPVYAIAIVATFVASVLVCFMIMDLKKRKQKKFFDKNGGEILKSMGIKIFTERQMKKITNHYSTPIGEGAFGKVFLGTITGTDHQVQKVAVKCAIMKAKKVLPKEEFVNEITFQFRISHVNLVRLIGCCLETFVPMLVFEFVPKGSLYNMLHGASMPTELLLPARLDIAIGTAEALTYMHSQGWNHVHGDVKSGNILLDDNLTPKVSDFGSSKLVSIASRYPKWVVSGDMNYIDPVYIKSGRFTVKSDVYSFEVVLLELITRKTARYEDSSLPIDFVKTCKVEGNGRKMFDQEILSHPQSLGHIECLDSMGALAVQCLKEDVDERPTMAEVVVELKKVKLKACGCGGP
ncbi:unnamed protein product [Urochloa humidicola]